MYADTIEKYDLLEIENPQILDLECGAGNSFEYLKWVQQELGYYGLDIESSPEVEGRERDDLSFDTLLYRTLGGQDTNGPVPFLVGLESGGRAFGIGAQQSRYSQKAQ